MKIVRASSGYNVVWFKRDLRVQDNAALASASATGPVLPLYVVEPEYWRQADTAQRHWEFVAESLGELRVDLAAIGQPLVIRIGDVVEILNEFRAQFGINALWSHEETGNDWTYRRDQRVAAWCREHGLSWKELRNHGVQRRLKSRDGWAKNWDSFMSQPQAVAPELQPLAVELGPIPSAADLGLTPVPCPDRQMGGRQAALERLSSFVETRGKTYRSTMSTPLEGATTCSRISPHLAWGTLSVREATQATWARQAELKASPPKNVTLWRGSLKSFTARLHWHCHFIQKLEDDPRIEFENFHRGYEWVRPSVPDRVRLSAWANGETGLPFVDACMRSLRATGWLNFRMRAMLTAVASYHLWLHWREPGLELARLFTDYEPGIHWSQVQMQSGTTGINTVRIYNPVKQGHDQDPTGAFTRRWIPELAAISDKHLQEPWKAENAAAVLGKVYPEPILDHLGTAKSARERIWAVRGGPEFRAEAAAIQIKHGSRKSGIPSRGRRIWPKQATQLDLPLEE